MDAELYIENYLEQRFEYYYCKGYSNEEAARLALEDAL